jgi:nudix-type nucleoside diphosphatase (YffH/AdpP family)
MEIELIDVDTVFSGWGKYLVATFHCAGQTIRREIEDHGTAAAVLPYDAERRTAVLVRQFRAPAHFAAGQKETLEAIAGIVESSDPAACVRREAMEEAGLALAELEHVAKVWSMPGVSTERVDLYLAPYRAADRVAPGGGVAGEHETITVAEIPLAELACLADTGRLDDMKTLALLQTLRLRRPELFATTGSIAPISL